jgi:thioredoxin-related protein
MIEDGAPIRIHMFGNDREQDQLQADKWSIRGVPTTVFTDEAEEIGFFQFPGRVPKDKFLSLFDIIEKELKNAGPDGPNDTGSQS